MHTFKQTRRKHVPQPLIYAPHIFGGMYDKMLRHNYIPRSHQKLHRSRTPDALINSNVTLPDVLLYFQRQEIYKIGRERGKEYGSDI